MRFLSVCSGIEAASVAWSPLGWKAVAFSEIEPFPCAVLAHHYHDTPNWGDMTKYKDWPDVSIDLLCGGTPCQSFSVAGLRKGLDDPRGNLMLTFGAIAAKYRPQWLVWENVPGVLSSNGGADFGAFLGMLGQLGYGFAYRVFDAQYFGVAQRRRRVFVVGCLGDWRSAAAVLFERHSLQGHPAPSRKAGQRPTGTLSARTEGGGGLGTDFELGGGLVPECAPTLTSDPSSPASHGKKSGTDREVLIPVAAYGGNDTRGAIDIATARNACGSGSGRLDFESETFLVTGTLNANGKAAGSATQQDAETGMLVPMLDHALRGEGFDASEDGTGRGTPLVPMFLHTNKGRPDGRRSAHTEMVSVKDIVETLTTDGHAQSAVAVPVAYGIRTANTSSNGWGIQEECTHTLDCAQGVAVAFTTEQTPKFNHECALTLTKQSPTGGGQIQSVMSAMQVRRLTPVECERLQGFPTVSEKITIQACLDHQNQSVRVALKCLRWQNSVSHADENELTQPAKTADARSSTSPAHLAPLAALHVRMHSVDELLEIRSAGRLIWSASGAGQSRKSLPPTLTENSVQEIARLLREVARTITAGKAESPPSIRLSFPASSGAINAEKSGREMEESASDAMSDQHRATFTTSDLGLITTFSDSTAETLSCFALHAIAGCIPSTTLPETFSIEMTVETPYTAITHRNKLAADGPRYKALGNSWAVPNVRWIGQRIDAVALINKAQAATKDVAELEAA